MENSGTTSPLRQTHAGGEKVFVDYCGQTMTVHDPVTGDAQEAQIFVACLGASNYTFAEATPAQTLPSTGLAPMSGP